jgi:hypothetical protein
MNFTETIVARLGTRHEAFGISDAALILVAITLLVGLEIGLHALIRTAVVWLSRRGLPRPAHPRDTDGN